MSGAVLPFEIQALGYDPRPGRARLEEDVRKLTARARMRLSEGDHEGARALARLALRYYRAAYPKKPGPA